MANVVFRRRRTPANSITGSRKIYIFGMVLCHSRAVFFSSTFSAKGLPQRVPTAVVDMDHSAMSRSVTLSLARRNPDDIYRGRCESYDDALDRVRRGKIFGFLRHRRTSGEEHPRRQRPRGSSTTPT